MQFLPNSPEQVWTRVPHEGTVEPFVAAEQFKLLLRWTQSADRCLSGKWEGGGSDQWRTDVRLVTPDWFCFVWACSFGDLGEWLVQRDSLERPRTQPQPVSAVLVRGT